MRSYRRERMGELRGDFRRKHTLVGLAAQGFIRARTPIGTPASTGDPNYPVTAALQRSIQFSTNDYHWVDIGTNKPYGPYVHQGTYDYAHGYGGWTEPQAREFDSLTDTGDGPGVGRKGMRARPFLVNGLLNGRPTYNAIYGKPIN